MWKKIPGRERTGKTEEKIEESLKRRKHVGANFAKSGARVIKFLHG